MSASAKDDTAFYTVKGLKDGEIRMIGSSEMIRGIYKLDRGAEQRIIREGDLGCHLYGNGRREDITVKYLAEAWQILGERDG